MLNIAVFISGRGSNLSSIIEYFKENLNIVSIKYVISNNKEAYGLKIAKSNNIPTFLISPDKLETEKSYDILAEKLKNNDVDLIVLAGYLKKIPDSFIDKFENKIINIHPALLPSFGGKGMYGLNVHQAVFNKSVKVTGASVHFVNKVYDEGLIIAQQAVDISDVENAEEIAEKVLKIEHTILPYVISKIAEHKIIIKNNRVYINE
ncbi:MAG: phosphoribosylglycinamide formyltransferase [bacterium]